MLLVFLLFMSALFIRMLLKDREGNRVT